MNYLVFKSYPSLTKCFAINFPNLFADAVTKIVLFFFVKIKFPFVMLGMTYLLLILNI